MKKYSIRNICINLIPNLAHFPSPGRKAKIEKNTYLMLKWLKPQIINSQSFILSHQTLTTFKIPM